MGDISPSVTYDGEKEEEDHPLRLWLMNKAATTLYELVGSVVSNQKQSWLLPRSSSYVFQFHSSTLF